ncbi:MAG TPA: hypothetical protein VL025_21135 [Thermoanaerobaculia bacterium]|nr:hypothetical protein [Thermoanaerobaculia bacterium]
MEEKPKVDAFEYFFGRKEKQEGEEGSSDPEDSERPPYLPNGPEGHR